jgi:3-oxoadipate enol-lactonase
MTTSLKVLLLHAFPLDERMWEPQREALDGYEVLAPRLYGRGQTMDAWADSIAGEMDGEAVVVGASMGGYCALALARRAPDRVRGLLLLGARPDSDSEERRAGRADTIELIRTEGPEGLWSSMVAKLFSDQSVADESLLFRDADALIGAVEAIRDRADSTGVARDFDGPVQFVVGESDPFVSARELREFDVRELAGAGHLANIERPDEFNEVLREFLARV